MKKPSRQTCARLLSTATADASALVVHLLALAVHLLALAVWLQLFCPPTRTAAPGRLFTAKTNSSTVAAVAARLLTAGRGGVRMGAGGQRGATPKPYQQLLEEIESTRRACCPPQSSAVGEPQGSALVPVCFSNEMVTNAHVDSFAPRPVLVSPKSKVKRSLYNPPTASDNASAP